MSDKFLFAQAKLFSRSVDSQMSESRPTLEERSRVFCVASGKGGTGKSFIASFLASQLAKEGKKVLLFDADFGLSDAHLYLGVRPKHDISALLKDDLHPNSSVLEPVFPQLDYLYGGSGLAQLAQLSSIQWGRLLKALFHYEKIYSHIVIDLAAGIGPQVLSYLICSPEIFLVTNPDSLALLDAYALLKVLAQRKYEGTVYLVLNRAASQRGEKAAYALQRGAEKMNAGFKISYLGSVSESMGLAESLKLGRPFLDLYPYDPAAIDLRKISKKLLEETGIIPFKSDMSYFLKVQRKGGWS
ncbi:MAG: P-loop NTPase [Deltaproteobacteria bacterium]|nr:P-loop NTPase [Deltaproteobacteria bacterium]